MELVLPWISVVFWQYSVQRCHIWRNSTMSEHPWTQPKGCCLSYLTEGRGGLVQQPLRRSALDGHRILFLRLCWLSGTSMTTEASFHHKSGCEMWSDCFFHWVKLLRLLSFSTPVQRFGLCHDFLLGVAAIGRHTVLCNETSGCENVRNSHIYSLYRSDMKVSFSCNVVLSKV